MDWMMLVRVGLAGIGVIWLITFAIFAFLIATAPDGREDEDGFHEIRR